MNKTAVRVIGSVTLVGFSVQAGFAHANDPYQPIINGIQGVTITALTTAATDSMTIAIPDTVLDTLIHIPRFPPRDVAGQS
jgi:hypothetical protein